jgi:pimeloyl-ACP methyl ester carboxylesterase
MENEHLSPLILLHGALGTSEQFDFLVPELEDFFNVHRLNFEGHGDTGPTNSPFRVSYFVENVLGYMDEHDIDQANFFGYSMGGYVAIILAKNFPERVKKVATAATILQWDEEVAERECKYLHPEKIKEKVPHFADQLNERHRSGWERVVNNTRDMLHYLGVHPEIRSAQWKEINCPLRFHIGDRDTTAGLNETVEIYQKTENSELVVLPKTDHPIAEIDKDLIVLSLKKFFREIKKPGHNDRAQKKNGRKN